MHSLLVAFFAALFSFGHATSVHQAETNPTFTQTAFAEQSTSYYAVEQVRTGTVYAGERCLSCSKMNASYTVR